MCAYLLIHQVTRSKSICYPPTRLDHDEDKKYFEISAKCNMSYIFTEGQSIIKVLPDQAPCIYGNTSTDLTNHRQKNIQEKRKELPWGTGDVGQSQTLGSPAPAPAPAPACISPPWEPRGCRLEEEIDGQGHLWLHSLYYVKTLFPREKETCLALVLNTHRTFFFLSHSLHNIVSKALILCYVLKTENQLQAQGVYVVTEGTGAAQILVSKVASGPVPRQTEGMQHSSRPYGHSHSWSSAVKFTSRIEEEEELRKRMAGRTYLSTRDFTTRFKTGREGRGNWYQQLFNPITFHFQQAITFF